MSHYAHRLARREGILAGFSAGLVQLYLKTPGMRQPGSLKPTPDGIALAKDVWLLGAGLTLLLDRDRSPKTTSSDGPAVTILSQE